MAVSASNRQQVLSLFKKLLRTGQHVFHEDTNAVQAARNKIKSEFVKHKAENDPGKVEELLKMAKESDEILKTKVIQAKEVRPNVYRIRDDHLKSICINAKRERCADCTCGA